MQKINKILIALFSCIALSAGCNLCGTVFTFCTPTDQLNLMFPILEYPDYYSDPSCTIPLGCSNGDLFPPLENGPGGNPSDQPSDEQGGGLGGGAGGGI